MTHEELVIEEPIVRKAKRKLSPVAKTIAIQIGVKVVIVVGASVIAGLANKALNDALDINQNPDK